MAINLEDAFSYLNIPQEGIGSFQLPTAKPITPEYDVEFDIDDTGKIGLRSYLKEFGDTAKEGIGTFADKGMSLFDDSRKSNLMRAGLGSLLFGFSPLTAILGAVIGAKTPKVFDYFQQQEDRRAEEEAERLRQIDLEEKRRLSTRIPSGGDGGSDPTAPGGPQSMGSAQGGAGGRPY